MSSTPGGLGEDSAPQSVAPGKGFATNAAYLATLTAANYLLGLLIFPLLSRVLSIEQFGLLGFSMAYVTLFQVIVEFGFMISATAAISRHRQHPAEVGRIISTTMLAKCVLAVVATLAFAISALWIPIVSDHVVEVTLFFLGVLITAMIPDFYFRGVERMRSIAVRAVLSKAIALLVIAATVYGDAQFVMIPVALAGGNGLALALAFITIRQHGVPLPRATLRDAIASIRAGAGYFASRVAASVNQMAGSFVLGLHYSPASAPMGQFSGATRISSAGELAVVPISDALYPRMVRTADYGLFRRVFLRGLAVWFIGCSAVFAFAEPICALVLGEQFRSAGALLRILVVGTFMAYASNLFGYPALAPIGLASQANIALLVSATMNVAAYSVLLGTGSITTERVCAVMAATNFVVFAWRASALALYWARHKRPRSATGAT